MKLNLHDPFIKKLALGFLVATFVMVAFPPHYRMQHPQGQGGFFLGYWFIGSTWNGLGKYHDVMGAPIDYGRLVLQEIGLITLCGVIYIKKKS